MAASAPATANTLSQTFTVDVRNTNRLYFLLNPDPSIPTRSCHGYYDRASNAFFLYNDALTALSNVTLQNSQCAIDGGASGLLAGAGTDLTFRMTMSLKGVFAGSAQKLNYWIVDYDGNGTAH